MTSPWVMAAMMRSVPRPHAGQRSMSKAKTRFSSRAHPQRGEALPASGALFRQPLQHRLAPCLRSLPALFPAR
jgi:hypothetical protein